MERIKLRDIEAMSKILHIIEQYADGYMHGMNIFEKCILELNGQFIKACSEGICYNNTICGYIIDKSKEIELLEVILTTNINVRNKESINE